MRHPIKVKFLSTLFIFFISPLSVLAQDFEIDDLEKALKKSSPSSSISKSQNSTYDYQSFIQAEYQNSIKQLEKTDTELARTEYYSKLKANRIEIASKLCSLDKRACFLIDEYRTSKLDYNSSQKLEIFGIDIFGSYPMTEEASQNISASQDYSLKIGDLLRINIVGSLSVLEDLKILPDGTLPIPEIGNIQVQGLTLEQAKVEISKAVKSKVLGAEIFISLLSLGTNQIYVLGAVNFPGSYSISPFSSTISALIASGGFLGNASLRQIEVVREGKIIESVDLYSFLINGDTTSNIQLEFGDAILVKGTSDYVEISGEVNRPAIYEIKGSQTLSDLIQYSLGITPFADISRISIKRSNDSGDTEIINTSIASDVQILPGDIIEIPSNEGSLVNNITIHGEIKTAGLYKFEDNMTLGDLISISSDTLDSTYTAFGILKSFSQLTKAWDIDFFHLLDQTHLLSIKLSPKDEIYVFSKEDINFINSERIKKSYFQFLDSFQPSNSSNQSNIKRTQERDLEKLKGSLTDEQKPSIEENYVKAEDILLSPDNACLSKFLIKRGTDVEKFYRNKFLIVNSYNQTTCTSFFNEFPELLPIALTESIPVTGNVRFPSLLPRQNSVTPEALIEIAGGYQFLNSINIYEVGLEDGRVQIVNDVSPKQMTDKKISFINIKIKKDTIRNAYVTLIGEFDNPGIYPIGISTTLSEVYRRSGGLTNYAYPQAAILTRESIKLKESNALAKAQAELTEILATAAGNGMTNQSSSDIAALVGLISEVSSTQGVGRLVAELDPIKINRDLSKDTLLENGDVLYMPTLQQYVTIVGSVLNPVTVPYSPDFSHHDYIRVAGGLKSHADKSRVYFISPNGIANSVSQKKLFSLGRNQEILPGTTIIVPRKSRILDSISLVETLTPVLANLSVTAAAIASINN